MFSALKRIPALAKQTALKTNNTRNLYGYYGRPRAQLSLVETWVHSAVIIGGIIAIPCWIMCHITEYRHLDEHGNPPE